MFMPIENNIMILAVDGRIWIDSFSLISYLRDVEIQADTHLKIAEDKGDYKKAIAAYSVGDSIRQIADGLVLTSMVADETIRSRRESRR
jgi:hypothetical protein